MKKSKYIHYLVLLILVSFSTTGRTQLVSGPMNGYSTMREVGVWVETKMPVPVHVKYVEEGSTDTLTSKVVLSEGKDFYIAQIIIGGLLPGKVYNYEVWINDQKQSLSYQPQFETQPLWQWRENPPEFTFVAGSCNYVSEAYFDRPGTPYGGAYEIFESIADVDPAFMLWLGDNTYLREADWDSEYGIYYRYHHTRKVKEMQRLLGEAHHYAVWDDHDYGPNDSDRSYAGKEITLQAFKDYWMNPSIHAGGSEGITGMFSWADCDFFVLDNRWYRTMPSDQGSILSTLQIQWLIEALSASKASFKFICIGGQFVSDLEAFENHAVYKKERALILELLEEYNIKNVVFLNGDRHHSEISSIQMDNGNSIYEITSSPLTSKAYDHSDETNNNRVEGSLIGVKNFAEIKVSGQLNERVLDIVYKDTQGKVLFTYQIDGSRKDKK